MFHRISWIDPFASVFLTHELADLKTWDDLVIGVLVAPTHAVAAVVFYDGGIFRLCPY